MWRRTEGHSILDPLPFFEGGGAQDGSFHEHIVIDFLSSANHGAPRCRGHLDREHGDVGYGIAEWCCMSHNGVTCLFLTADSGTGDAGSGLRALRVTGRRTGKRRARQALLPIDPDGPWRKHRKTIDELEEEEEEEDGEDEMPAQGGAAGLNDFVVESSLSQLMAMGFDKLKCQDALLEAGGDIEAAAEFLFSACV
uniref:UBA domain-containing protein n=1 Tax=Tetraselmis sp. GSL018 TaxID=582737 RepID=A0A061S801_9CHLO